MPVSVPIARVVLVVILVLLLLTSVVHGLGAEQFVLFNTPLLRAEYAKQHIAHDKHKGTLTKCNKDDDATGTCTTLHYRQPTPQLNDTNSNMLANHKAVTSRTLQLHGIPCPKFVYVSKPLTSTQMQQALTAHGITFPVVVKPIDGTQGYDVHLNVHTVTDVCRLCDTLLRTKKRKVIVEEQVQGDNYRVMVHHGKVFDIVKRETASVTGDGVRTVQQLIDARNVQQKARKLFPTHNVDEGHLRKQLQLPAHTDVMAHVLVNGKTVAITNVENYHNGCNTTRVPLSKVHPDNLAMFAKVNDVLGLNLSGLDYMCTSPMHVSHPAHGGGVVIEVNPGPCLNMHKDALQPDTGKKDAGVTARFVSGLFG